MISAKVIEHSINQFDKELITFEIVFPRIVLAELNTHRMLTKNSASSRAIPFKRMLQLVQENPFLPIAYQAEHKGMQGSKYIEDKNVIGLKNEIWLRARDGAVEQAIQLSSDVKKFTLDGGEQIIEGTGVTKQICNRLLEPFMWHKVLITGTEWENFFNLRCSNYELYKNSGKTNENTELKMFRSREDAKKEFDDVYDLTDLEWMLINQGMAEIHIRDLAEKMWDAKNNSKPKHLEEGQWHIPYGDQIKEKELEYFRSLGDNEGNLYPSIETLKLKIGTARCARLSYQTLGQNPKIDYAADISLHDKLSGNGHSSPFEHCARSMSEDEYYAFGKTEPIYGKDSTVTGQKIDSGWCRNFNSYIQYRHILNI